MYQNIKLFIFIVIATLPTAFAVAESKTLPDGVWSEPQYSEKGVQWYVIPRGMGAETTLNFVTYDEDGERVTYFLIRLLCGNGSTEFYKAYPGHELSQGANCSGEYDYSRMVKIALLNVDDLPDKAKKFIE
jgi:hypothetical protein